MSETNTRAAVADAKATDLAPSFLVIVEGGAGLEQFHTHATRELAEADRIACARDSRSTSIVIEVAPELNVLGKLFYETVDAIVASLASLDCVEFQEADGDPEGDSLLAVFEEAQRLAEEGVPRPSGTAFVVIQEGGSSGEIYVHSHSSVDEAEDDRVSCARGAYRTTDPVEIDARLADLGETFYEAVEKVLEAIDEMECVDVPQEAEVEAESRPAG